MKKWEMKTTPLVVFVLIIVLGIYDLGCVVFTGTGSSVSSFLVESAHLSPVFTFMMGCIAGHLFFYMTRVDE